MAGEWEILRLAVVIHDETRAAIASEVDYGPPQMDRMTNTALVLSALLADSLLVSSFVYFAVRKRLIPFIRSGDVTFFGTKINGYWGYIQQFFSWRLV